MLKKPLYTSFPAIKLATFSIISIQRKSGDVKKIVLNYTKRGEVMVHIYKQFWKKNDMIEI